jgi:hypothetical protein
MSDVKKIAIGCAAGAFGAGLLVVLLIAWLASGPESGVKLSNEMDDYALNYLEEHQILLPNELLVAYFDNTISMDGTEAAILTNQRVIDHRNGKITAIALAEIAAVDHRKETLLGDVIEIRSKGGNLMKIKIAPLNQGETFVSSLMQQWKSAQEP